MGAYRHAGRRGQSSTLDEVIELFPVLGERRSQLGGDLSGGEQQMLAIGRALMGEPRVLLLDEPSMGLAPLYVERIFGIIEQIRARGVTILLVEQNAAKALELSDRGYVLETGNVVLEGPAKELLGNDRVRMAYLGEDIGGA
jgi:branched-chain amino acid transport system ATP-binding protein